jgi:hypothetical protein
MENHFSFPAKRYTLSPPHVVLRTCKDTAERANGFLGPCAP